MFKKPNDLAYLRFLRRLHRRMTFDWYLEVGSRTGRSISEVRGNAICVDPYFQIERNVIGPKSAFMAFQMTSDAFFETGVLRDLNVKLGFAFLDGMHLMEYLLRDFINAEAHMAVDGVIALHDCCPFSHEMTTRDVAQAPQDAWTGDVWKLIPILKTYRPDLTVTVLGCRPTGLVLVHGLDPANTVLRDNLDAIRKEWELVTLADYGVATFNDHFEFTSVADVIAQDFPMFGAGQRDDGDSPKPTFVSP